MSNLRSNQKTEQTLEKRFGSPNSLISAIVSPILKDKYVGNKLGPGSYNVSLSTLSGPSYLFSASTRFKHEDPYARYMNLSRKSSYQGFHLPGINIDSFRPDAKLNKLKEEADSLNNRLLSTQLNKKKLQSDKKNRMLEKLKEKKEKFEVRKKSKELSQLSSKFFILICAAFVSSRANTVVVSWKFHKNRVKIMLKRLYLVSVFLGKLKQRLTRFRIKRSKSIISQFVGRFRVWIVKRKNEYRLSINNIVEDYLARPLLGVLLRKFLVNTVCIQRFWRKAIDMKRVALEAKIRIFRHIESEVRRKGKKKRSKIPKKNIVKELLKYRKNKLKDYLSSMKKHKQRCERLQRTYSRVYLKVRFTYMFNTTGNEVSLPEKPHEFYTIKKKKYVEMVNRLFERMSLWDT